MGNILLQYPQKIEAGTLERGNELGMQILGDGLWPEVPGGIKSIGLGQTRDNHAFVRPYLANTLDKGNWPDDWLRSRASAFFAHRHQVESADMKWWTAQLLYKIHLDLDINEAQAKEFAAFKSSMLLLPPFSEEALQSWALDVALSAKKTLAKKTHYLEIIKSAIRSKYANEAFVKTDDAANIELLASVMLDSMVFAGGASIPTVLQCVLALTHAASHTRHNSLKNVRLDSSNHIWILWETLRKYAPVAGVPSWQKQEDGSFKHVVPNLFAALQDASVFESPLEFKDRGAALYKSKLQDTGMPWAGPAVQQFSDGTANTAAPHSHNCPAQDLSFRIMKAFLEAFIERGGSLGWSAVDESITVTSYGASSFALLVRGHTYVTDCYWFPSCNDGYSRVSYKWCSWGRSRYTCKVA